MSKLELYTRPLVIFDPSKKEHRRLYANFLASGSWRGCPYRFAVEDDYGYLIGHIQRELIEYYMGKEFNTQAKNTSLLIHQKKQKTVDKQPKRQYNKATSKNKG